MRLDHLLSKEQLAAFELSISRIGLIRRPARAHGWNIDVVTAKTRSIKYALWGWNERAAAADYMAHCWVLRDRVKTHLRPGSRLISLLTGWTDH